MTRVIRTYSELRNMPTLRERFDYLKLGGQVGVETFGFDRWMNQAFYRSREWRLIRDDVIVRDDGFELGSEDALIRGASYIHHMNPLTPDDIENATDNLINPEYLISCSLRTHNAVHYGDDNLLPQPYVERRPGDTTLWTRRF